MNPPSYDQSILEDKIIDDKSLLHYQIRFTRGHISNNVLHFTIMSEDGEVVDSSEHNVNNIPGLIEYRNNYNSEKPMDGLIELISILINYFGSMTILSGYVFRGLCQHHSEWSVTLCFREGYVRKLKYIYSSFIYNASEYNKFRCDSFTFIPKSIVIFIGNCCWANHGWILIPYE